MRKANEWNKVGKYQYDNDKLMKRIIIQSETLTGKYEVKLYSHGNILTLQNYASREEALKTADEYMGIA